MKKISRGMKSRKSSNQGLSHVRYNSRKGSIGGVNNSLEDTTSSTTSSATTSEIPEDNSSFLSTTTVEEYNHSFGNKRSRFNTSPTLKTPVRGNKYSRRSNEIEPIVMKGTAGEGGDDEFEDENEKTPVSNNISNNNSETERERGVIKNFIGGVEKKHDGKRWFDPTNHMDAGEYLDQIRKQIAFPKFKYDTKLADKVWRLGTKRIRDDIQDRKDELNKNSQRVRVERNAKIARFRKFGNERDKSEIRGHHPMPTDKHEIPYQGLLQKFGDIEKCLNDEELRDILLPERHSTP